MMPPWLKKKWIASQIWPNDPQAGQRLADRSRPEGHPSKVSWKPEEIRAYSEAMKRLAKLAEQESEKYHLPF